jgi:hypothetical protein
MFGFSSSSCGTHVLCSNCHVGLHEAHSRCLRQRERYPRQLLHLQSGRSVLHACRKRRAIKTATEQQQHHNFTGYANLPCSISAATKGLQICKMTKRDCQFGRCCELGVQLTSLRSLLVLHVCLCFLRVPQLQQLHQHRLHHLRPLAPPLCASWPWLLNAREICCLCCANVALRVLLAEPWSLQQA